MSENNNAATARTVSADVASKQGKLSITSLVLLAVLLAAGTILNMTVGNALATVGIKPQFIIAAYALAILLTNANFGQAAIFGLISAAVIQLSTSIPGLNFFTELCGALTMCAIAHLNIKVGGKNVTPLVATFVATLVSGALFAVCGNVIMGAAMATALVKVPIVLGTACFNAIVVQALYLPLSKVMKR
ncbi:MAG: hypothetical protein ACOYJL_04575 [Tractidigestivibacter sp.]|jgi:hypothetical protein|uniref:hypothetical protein n=1 Tax=Tractidigestivibacter sp. TaxID=2847320 RepID=UPI003D8C10CC